ncbi:MAG: SH3 domain-containing protein [Burkholderiales bacterium]|nr:SH3 domain-containing protein [Burkholderiales bacterium]PZN04160.1 MAG: hypothetical protein DIU74_04180 [Pseudomonadota bacterium]
MKRLCACLLGLGAACAAYAADFRSIGQDVAILYDGPSTQAKKLYVVSRQLPVEIISTDGTWVKVRDHEGTLAWIERSALSEQRMVLVTAAVAEVREAPDAQAPVVFQAQQGVVLELQGQSVAGWLQVRHADGSGGYVRFDQVWGG